MQKNIIPDRLIKARERLGINKSQAAKRLGLSPIGYLRYEQGLRDPSPQMIELIAQRLETSVEYLTGCSDNPQADILIISNKEDAVIYELVINLRAEDIKVKQRLLAYYKKWAREQK